MFSEASQITTYLSMVRTDQTQISQILDETFYELQNNIDYSQQQDTAKTFEPFFKQCKIFLFGQINFQDAVVQLQKASGGSSGGVCAKTMKSGDVAWKCDDCELDPTCIICQDCFEKGNHKGHKVWLKKNVSGCCDCGDLDAWRENGFCTDHKGYTASSENLLQSLPPYIKSSSKYVFDYVCKQLKIQCLNLQDPSRLLMNGIQNLEPKQVINCYNLIKLFFEFLDFTVQVSPAFIHQITESINKSYHDQVKLINTEDKEDKQLDAENDDPIDSNLQQISSQDEIQQTIRKLEIAQEQNKICVCTTLDLTLQINTRLNNFVRTTVYEFYFKLFQSYRFKQLLGLSFAANFEVINKDRDETMKNHIGSIGVQILTIDDIGLMIMKDPQYRYIILKTYEKAIDALIDSNYELKQVESIYHILFDLKYLCRPKCLNYIIYQTSFLESLLEQLTKFYFTDKIEFREQHIMFDHSIYKEGLINIDIQLTKIYKKYLKELDPSNIQRNKRLITAFISFFQEINELFNQQNTMGFFVIPLHRVFSYYLSRLIMYNYIKEKDKINQRKSQKEVMVEIFRRYFECQPGQNNLRQIAIVEIISPLSRQWAFCNEIMSGKWVMSGVFINQFPKLLYMVAENYLYLILGLFQTLIAISPEPELIVKKVLQIFEMDEWMKLFYSQLMKKNLNLAEFDRFQRIFGVKKLRQMVHFQLRFLIQLCTSEIPFMYPLIGDIERKDKLFYQDEKSDKAIEDFLKNEIKRQIAHSLISLGGKGNIKDIKKASEELYTQSSLYEDSLLQVTQSVKDNSSKTIFKLKEEYLKWFEPYYYLNPESMQRVMENVQSLKKENKQLDEILGDYQNNYKFNTSINILVRDGLSQSIMVTYLKELIINWSQSNKEFEVVDNQSGHECLKLLHLMIQSAQENSNNQRSYLIQVLTSSNYELIVAILKLKEQSDQMQISCDILLRGIYHLSPEQFQQLGIQLGIIQNEEQKQEDSNLSETRVQEGQSETSRLEALKEANKRKKELIMKKFQNKRQDYITKSSGSQTPQLSRQSSSFIEGSNLEEEISCSLCKEELSPDNFFSEPFGQFAYISRSNLMAHTLKQTLNLQDEMLQNQISMILIQSQKLIIHCSLFQEEMKSYELEQVEEQKNDLNKLKTLDIDYLHKIDHTGGTIIKCSHFSHFKCLNDYLISNETDIRKRDIRKLIGLDFNNFQCPLCRHLSNGLIPYDTLHNYQERKFYQKDFNQIELLSIYAGFLSRINKNQQVTKKETLLIDIKQNSIEILESVSQFIEHRLQLIDIKGTYEFLKKSKHHVTRSEYSQILELSYNTSKIIVDSGISLGGTPFDDEDMTELSLDDMCIQKFKQLIKMRQEIGKSLIDSDVFSLGFKLIFYIYMILGGKQGQLEKIITTVIQQLFMLVKTQAIIRALFLVHRGKINENYDSLKELLSFENLKQLSSNLELEDYLIRSQLPFLRKMLCLKIMISDRSNNQNSDYQIHSDQLTTTFGHLNDDHEEFEILVSELKVDSSFDFLSHDYRNNKNDQRSKNTLDKFTKQQDQTDNFVDVQLQELITSTKEEKMKEVSAFDHQQNSNSHEDELSFGDDELSKFIISQVQSLTSIDQIQQQINLFVQNYKIKNENESQQLIVNTQDIIEIKMPNQLKILDTYFKFKLIDLPKDFQSLIQKYYKVKCKNCNTQPKSACICLLCGEITCYVQKCCFNLPGMRDHEGELTFHTRTCEGGSSLFMNIANGKIICIEADRSAQKNSPYINKYGETFSDHSKKWDNFYLEESTGGTQIYEDFRKMVMNFSMSNDIIQHRSSSDTVLRLRVI